MNGATPCTFLVVNLHTIIRAILMQVLCEQTNARNYQPPIIYAIDDVTITYYLKQITQPFC